MPPLLILAFVANLLILVTCQPTGPSPLEKQYIKYWGTCANNVKGSNSTWHLYDDNCYKWSGEHDKANWFRAQLNCRAEGGHLVSIGNKKEASVVHGLSLCRNKHWIGQVNTDSAKDVRQSEWSWWDFSDKNFTKLEAENVVGKDCIYSDTDGKWKNSYCSGERMETWVCKKSSHINFFGSPGVSGYRASTKPPELACPSGWTYYHGQCYFFSNEAVNYFHAQLACQNSSAHVVTIKNKDEHSFLQAVNGCEKKFWIGLERALPCLSTNNNECWEWTDLSKVVYSNWEAKYPTDHKDFECAHSAGYWENSMKCHETLYYICKKHAKV